VPITAAEIASCAKDVLRAVGAGDARVDAPTTERAAALLRARVTAALMDVRPDAAGASLGELVSELLAEAKRGWPDAARARKALAELRAVFDQVAFRRTRRAERARVFGQLVVLLELESAAGVALHPEGDLEERLRRLRLALRQR
jgi:hypothetical protein